MPEHASGHGGPADDRGRFGLCLAEHRDDAHGACERHAEGSAGSPVQVQPGGAVGEIDTMTTITTSDAA